MAAKIPEPKRVISRTTNANVNFGELTERNPQMLAVLSGASCPVALSDEAIAKAVENMDFCRFAFFTDVHVGYVIGHHEAESGSVEIKAIAVLPAYRRLKLATGLLNDLATQILADDRARKPSRNISRLFMPMPTGPDAELLVNLFKGAGFKVDGGALVRQLF
eukprot:c2725_g1_i1.p2 GENE.c2725_g1_i1~~c2725_g1_i1.p2  ORF type:complete len:163 (-),score=30.28 c2725_g1_i1:390-878(-)